MTGAGRGLGRAVALRLARDGAQQLLVDIDPASAANTADEPGGLGAEARALAADVADDHGCEQVVEAAADTFGAPEILVNVANYPVPPARAEEIELEHWHRAFAAGPLAMFRLARAVSRT